MTSEIQKLVEQLFTRLARIQSDLAAERFERVLQSADEGLRICEQAPSDWEGVVSAAEGSLASNAFAAARRAGDLKRSLEYARREYAVAVRKGSAAVRVRALNNRGLAYHELNELVAAEADYRAALQIIEENPGEDLDSVKALVLSHLGQLLSTRGQGEEGLQLLSEAGTVEGRGLPFIELSDPQLSRANDLATVALNSRDYKRAETVLRDAIARSAGRNPQLKGILVSNLAEVLHQSGQYDNAIKTYGWAIQLHQGDPGCVVELATDYVNLAAVYTHISSFERMAESYKSAWDAVRKTNPRSLIALRALWGLAMVRMVQKDFERARAVISRGLDLYEEMRADVAVTESGHAGFLRAYRSLLEIGMYLALEESWPDELRSLIERGKARFALERMAQTSEHTTFEQQVRDFDKIGGINGLVLNFFVGPNATFISYQVQQQCRWRAGRRRRGGDRHDGGWVSRRAVVVVAARARAFSRNQARQGPVREAPCGFHKGAVYLLHA